MITHLGGKHGYINEVLVEKNLSVLPCNVNTTGYSAAKQKQLTKIKKERLDIEETGGSHNDIRKQLELEMDATSVSAPDVMGDKILEKYKDII